MARLLPLFVPRPRLLPLGTRALPGGVNLVPTLPLTMIAGLRRRAVTNGFHDPRQEDRTARMVIWSRWVIDPAAPVVWMLFITPPGMLSAVDMVWASPITRNR